MSALLFALIAVAAIVITVVSARRAAAERDAVERQRHTLDVIAGITGRPPPGPQPSTPPAKYHPRHHRGNRWRWAVVAAVAALVVAVAVAGVVGLDRRGGSRNVAASHPLADTTASSRATSSTTSTPATLAPVVTLVVENASQATYHLASAKELVQLVPSGPCWVEITGQKGVVLARTLRPPTQQSVPLAGAPVSVHLANPAAMSLLVDGTTVPFPSAGGRPYTLIFQTA